MKKQIKQIVMGCLGVTILIMSQVGFAKTFKPGDMEAEYYEQKIRLANGESYEIKENTPLLFVEGTVVPEYEVLMENVRSLVPLRVISEGLGYKVEWESNTKRVRIINGNQTVTLTIGNQTARINEEIYTLEVAPKMYQDSTYVPIRFVGEALEASVVYAPAMKSPFTYYYDTPMPVSDGATLIRDYGNILVDKKEEATGLYGSIEEAKLVVQDVCRKGLEKFRITTNASLEESGVDNTDFEQVYEQIDREIDRMMSLGKTSRYYKFTIGAYDILLDNITGDVYFVRYSSGIRIKKVDINDPYLYTSVFLIG